MEVDILHRHYLRVAAAGGAALHAKRRAKARLAQAQHRLLAEVVERIGEAHGGRGLALARRRRRDRRHQDQLAVGLARQRLDEGHRHLGLVVAVGIKVLRRDAESLARLGGGLRHQMNLVPAFTLAAAANSPAPILAPSAGFTRVTLMRPSAQTTVKLSGSVATTSPIFPLIPLGARAGSGVVSKICSLAPLSVVHAPGAGSQPRIRLWICAHGLPQSMRALSAPHQPS